MCQAGVLLPENRHPSEAPIENLRIEVRSVRPSHGAQFRIDANQREVSGVSQRLEHSVKAEVRREINHALNTVLEAKMQAIITERMCGNDVIQHGLLQRRI
jgi:hypothetical protein